MSLKIYYITGTHWDREWYLPFQQFRKYLLDTADQLIETLENDNSFTSFVFDGQSLIMEDILEIKPYLRQRLEALVRAGKLRIGPWYCMPDMFIPSGESLIRNLQFGYQLTRQFGGEVLSCGYMCDVFGNIAQAPQLMKLAGLEMAAIWRGVSDECPTYFKWQAPDGSEILTFHMNARQSYCDFTGQVIGYWDQLYPETKFKEKAGVYIEQLRQKSGDMVVIMDAIDHGPIHQSVPVYIKWLQELYPEATVKISDFSDLLADLQVNRAGLPVIKGEMVYPGEAVKDSYSAVLTHTVSARYPIKKSNDICTNLLELYLDPISAACIVKNIPCQKELLVKAWQYLLRNHPHDSICGCSIDQVHDDMQYRYRQILSLAPTLVGDFKKWDRDHFLGNDQIRECQPCGFEEVEAVSEMAGNGEFMLAIYNPLPLDMEGLRSFELNFPSDYPYQFMEYFGYETINLFRIYDLSGTEIPYVIEKIERNKRKNFYRYDHRLYNVYTVGFCVKLKASSWTRLLIKPEHKPVRNWGSMLIDDLTVSNGLIRLRFESDGSFSITDLSNHQTTGKFNRFIWDSEVGDGWNSHRAVNSSVILESGLGAQIKLLVDSRQKCVFEVTRQYQVPQGLEYRGTNLQQFGGVVESKIRKTVEIKSIVTVEEFSKAVKVQTIYDNQIKDFRLRLVVPTNLRGDYFANQSFCFLNRPEGRLTGNISAQFREFDPLEKNFAGICGKRDTTGNGIAFIAKYGLKEVSCERDKLYITLLRSFGRTQQTNGEDGGQNLGEQHFEYAYLPVSPETDNYYLYDFWIKYRAELLYYMVKNSGAITNCDQKSLLKISGKISYSAMTPSLGQHPGELVLRLVNMSELAENFTITSDYRIDTASVVDFREQIISDLSIRKNTIEHRIKYGEILTIKLFFAGN